MLRNKNQKFESVFNINLGESPGRAGSPLPADGCSSLTNYRSCVGNTLLAAAAAHPLAAASLRIQEVPRPWVGFYPIFPGLNLCNIDACFNLV